MSELDNATKSVNYTVKQKILNVNVNIKTNEFLTIYEKAATLSSMVSAIENGHPYVENLERDEYGSVSAIDIARYMLDNKKIPFGIMREIQSKSQDDNLYIEADLLKVNEATIP